MVALFYIKMKEDSLYFRNFFQSVDKFWEKGSGYGNFCGNSSFCFIDGFLLICYNNQIPEGIYLLYLHNDKCGLFYQRQEGG